MSKKNRKTAPGGALPMPEASPHLRDEPRSKRVRRRQENIDVQGLEEYRWWWGGLLVVLAAGWLVLGPGLPRSDTVGENWYAVVGLLLAVATFADAWHKYQENQRLTRGAADSLWLGLVSTLVTLLVFGVELGMFWPVLFIIAGLALLSAGLIPA